MCLMLQVHVVNAVVDIYLNDQYITNFNNPIAEPTNTRHIPVDDMATTGMNQILAKIKIQEAKYEKHDANGHTLAPRVQARLARIPRGEYSDWDSGETVATLDWTSRKDSWYQCQVSGLLGTQFTLPDSLPRWSWQDAEIVDLTPEVYDDIFALLQQARDLLHAGDTRAFWDLAEIRFRENALAYGKDPQEEYQKVADLIEAQKLTDQWAMRPVEMAKMQLYSHAYGRLIRVVHDHGRLFDPPLMSEGGGPLGAMAFTMWVAKIDGAWRIVR